MQNLNDMLYFAEVVDRGGFAAAGRALGVPRSKLSRRVAVLEGQLGVRLLHRTTRKLSLTQAGELYHRHCAAMRDEAAAAAEEVAQVQLAPRGLLRVTCPITLAQSTVGRVIAQFLGRYPEVHLEMLVTNRAVDLVEEGIDVALRVRPSLEDSGSLVAKPLGHSRLALVCAPGLLRRQGRPRGVEDLQQLDSVAMSAVDGQSSWRLIGPGGAEHTLVHHPRYVADDVLTLAAAVLEGIGMSLLPDHICVESLGNGRLVPVLPGWGGPRVMVHAVFPSRRGMVPAVRTFLDYLAEHVKTDQLVYGLGA